MWRTEVDLNANCQRTRVRTSSGVLAPGWTGRNQRQQQHRCRCHIPAERRAQKSEGWCLSKYKATALCWRSRSLHLGAPGTKKPLNLLFCVVHFVDSATCSAWHMTSFSKCALKPFPPRMKKYVHGIPDRPPLWIMYIWEPAFIKFQTNTNHSKMTDSVRYKWKTHPDWVIQPLIHNLVQRIRFSKIKISGEWF